MQFLASQDVNWWTGVVWIFLWIIVMFLIKLFGLSFWRHPFTAEIHWWFYFIFVLCGFHQQVLQPLSWKSGFVSALWRQEAHNSDPTPVRNILLSPSLFLFAYLTFLSFLIVNMRLDKNPAYPPLSACTAARRVKALASLTVREISHVASALGEANNIRPFPWDSGCVFL